MFNIHHITLFKGFNYLRRKLGIYDVLNLHYLMYSVLNNPNKYKSSKCKNYSFPPMEIITKSNIYNRNKEVAQVKLEFNSSNGFDFNKKNKLERNESYRWNAFYPLYSIYYGSNEPENRQLIVDYIFNWCCKYILDKEKNPFCWYDMADSFRLMLIIDILSNKDYLEYISVHKRKILDFSARIHHQVLMKNGYASKGNHRIFQLLSLLRYSKFIENKEDESKFKNEILKFYHLQFDKDGVHLEHSPEYHVWATLLFKEIFSNFDDLNNNSDLISKAMDFSKYLFCSNYKLALIGDSGLDNNTEYCNLIQPMFREKGSFSLENTHYIINGNDCLGQYFICILSANSRVHKHSDSGSFEFTTNKKKVITDSGKYSYTKSSKSKEIRSIKSHNVAYKVGYEVTNDLTYSIFEKTIQNEAVLYCIKGSGDYSDHTRFFIILEQSSLVVIDIFDKGDNYRSIVNFDPGLDWKKYYQPLLGIKSWEEEVGIHSQYYGEANENNRIVQTISNISCYAISSIPIERFSYTNNEIFIYYRKNEYTFKLKR